MYWAVGDRTRPVREGSEVSTRRVLSPVASASPQDPLARTRVLSSFHLHLRPGRWGHRVRLLVSGFSCLPLCSHYAAAANRGLDAPLTRPGPVCIGWSGQVRHLRPPWPVREASEVSPCHLRELSPVSRMSCCRFCLLASSFSPYAGSVLVSASPLSGRWGHVVRVLAWPRCRLSDWPLRLSPQSRYRFSVASKVCFRAAGRHRWQHVQRLPCLSTAGVF
ncbi:hypothetical protein NDU88_004853 [Pleurodeles waltl]|uniref:Uncharacterized protein n=1 Tax=Pleurodeles waltl TaxID=8319 RepID=A0AAV7UGD4_PLEWA|nr:hypothetical protein NDU88_004853 [Pleurodeles waltl]